MLAVAVAVISMVAPLLPATTVGAAPSEQTVDAWVTNDRVSAVRQVGDFIYLGGKFTRLGPPTGHGVEVDAVSGAFDPGSPHVDGVVFAAISDGEDGWYLGGQFSSVNEVGRTNVAHVLSDGTVSGWHPFTDRPVRALALAGDLVVLGGDFTQIRATPRARLGAVRADTGDVVGGWNPTVNGRVNALATHPDGTRVFAGGAFTQVDGQLSRHLASFDVDNGDLDPLFKASPDATVLALDVSPSGARVYLGGNFTFVGIVPRQRIAAVDSSTGLPDVSFSAGSNGPVRAIRAHPDGQRVYVGGQFSRLRNVPRGNLGAFDAAGSLLPWAPFALGSIETMALSPAGEAMVVGGFVRSINSTAAVFAGQVRLDQTGTPVKSFDVQADGVVRAVAWAGTTVFLGGGFQSVGSIRQPFLARLHADTGVLDADWTPTLNNYVLDLDTSPDEATLYAVGRFDTVNGQARGRGAAFDLSHGRPTNWDPGADGEIRTVEPTATDVYVGGAFGSLAGGNVNRFVGRTDPSSGIADQLWLPLPNRVVNDVEIGASGQPIYLGGDFTLLGLTPRARIGAVNNGGVPTNWNPGASSIVQQVEVSANETRLYAAQGGSPGDNGNAISAYQTNGAGSMLWKHMGTGDVQTVLEGPDGKVYAGGHFRRIAGNQLRTGLAAFDGPTGALTPFAPVVTWNDLGIWSLDLTPDGALLVGGDQKRVGNRALAGFTRFPDQP